MGVDDASGGCLAAETSNPSSMAPNSALPSSTQGRSPVPESGTPGSVQGVPGDRYSYRDLGSVRLSFVLRLLGKSPRKTRLEPSRTRSGDGLTMPRKIARIRLGKAAWRHARSRQVFFPKDAASSVRLCHKQSL